MNQELISIEEFAKREQKSIKTVKKNIDLLHGIVKKDDGIFILESARYPYFPRNFQLVNKDEKVKCLLLAMYRYKYIDEKILKLSKSSFTSIVEELEENNYIRKNKSNDPNGLNSYDITNEGVELLKSKKINLYNCLKRIVELAEDVNKARGK